MNITDEQILMPFRDYYDIIVYDMDYNACAGDDGLIYSDESRCGGHLVSFAQSHIYNERYFITHKDTLWSVSTHDYVYFFRADAQHSLTVGAFSEWADYAVDDALSLIKPSTEHLCSLVTLIIMCDTMPGDDILNVIRRYRRHKSFLCCLHGWMDVRAAVIDMGSGSLITNRKGKKLKKIFYNIQGALK